MLWKFGLVILVVVFVIVIVGGFYVYIIMNFIVRNCKVYEEVGNIVE